jgi:hypothetical protein
MLRRSICALFGYLKIQSTGARPPCATADDIDTSRKRGECTSVFRGLCLPMASCCQLEEAGTSVRRRFWGSSQNNPTGLHLLRGVPTAEHNSSSKNNHWPPKVPSLQLHDAIASSYYGGSGKPSPSAILDDQSVLSEGDCCFRPSLDRKLICSHGQLAIPDASEVLDNVFTVIVPQVDAMSEIRPAVHDLFKSSSISNAACVQSWARSSRRYGPMSRPGPRLPPHRRRPNASSAASRSTWSRAKWQAGAEKRSRNAFGSMPKVGCLIPSIVSYLRAMPMPPKPKKNLERDRLLE